MRVLLLALLTVLLWPLTCWASPAGYWKGSIDLPNGVLPINLTLEEKDQKWSGVVDVPLQGVTKHPLSELKVEGRKVSFVLKGIPGDPTFNGTVSDDDSSLTGKVSQGGQEMPFSTKRAKKPPEKASDPVPGEGVVGTWAGTLKVGAAEMRLGLTVKEEREGVLSAKLNSLDQGVILDADEVTFNDRNLTFTIKRIQGSFKGDLNKDGSSLEGSWTQGRSFPLTLHRTREEAKINRPQLPKPPFPYNAKDVTFRNEAAEITLAGTIITPPGEGPFPAVLFVSGSGPQDRDESLMGHKPFLVLADYLARRGIASLRFDDRGVAKSEGDHMGSTVADFSTDAIAGLTFLSKQQGIDRKRLGIIGHSEGGLSGPMAALKSNPTPAFLVLLAPPGEPLDQLIGRQAVDALNLQGVDPKLIERMHADREQEVNLLKDKSLGRDELREKLRANSKEWAKKFTKEELETIGYDEENIEGQLEMVTTPWFRSLIVEDPRVYLKQLKMPVLALLTEKDFQVSAKVNEPIIREALKAASNPDFRVETLPGLNHLFQTADKGTMDEYAKIEETFAPSALKIVGDWISERVDPKK